MRVVVADDTGLVKHVDVERGCVKEQWREQDRAAGVDAMCFVDAEEADGKVCATCYAMNGKQDIVDEDW